MLIIIPIVKSMIIMMMTMIIKMMIVMMMVTTVFVGSRSLERTLLWCFREKSVTLKFPWFIITFSFKMGRPAHTGTASNPKLPTKSCQCDGWTMWCWELRGMSLTSFWHPCNSARRWTSICHFDVPPKNACLSCFFTVSFILWYFIAVSLWNMMMNYLIWVAFIRAKPMWLAWNVFCPRSFSLSLFNCFPMSLFSNHPGQHKIVCVCLSHSWFCLFSFWFFGLDDGEVSWGLRRFEHQGGTVQVPTG